ncbi:lactonase family protein [Azorhizobium doebereinerae]|uniref:lactonase family protein n=1 Tax=Azorhizobium doebereinerae TaxID=281091 RepID=UPI001FDA50F0|nr:beta-propeller fold lactonase family protein [Azorhizobium doebereinerae]
MTLRIAMAGVAVAGAVWGNMSGAVAGTFVYVSNADSREISVLSLDERTGALTPVATTPTKGAVMPLALSPDRRHLYASLRSEPYSVSTFAVDPATGTLTEQSTVKLPDNMAYLSTDATGRFLLSASYTGDKIAINPIGPDGLAGETPVQVVPTGKNAHAIRVDPANTHVLASNLGSDVMLQFRFDPASGQVSPGTPPAVATAKGAGPRHFVFSPDGRFVYGTNELDGTVNSYRYDAAAGTLALIGTVSAVPPDFKGGAPATADIHLTPDGGLLYATERTSNTIAAYRVDAQTGALTPAGNFATETQPRGFAIDPLGRYLIAAGQKSGSATIYAINPESGALAPLGRQPLGKNPNWVEIVTLP